MPASSGAVLEQADRLVQAQFVLWSGMDGLSMTGSQSLMQGAFFSLSLLYGAPGGKPSTGPSCNATRDGRMLCAYLFVLQ